MESWQRDHIRKVKSKLLELTLCNSTLLHQLRAVNAFSDEDIAEIESKSTKYKQASCFYDIVETRSNSYIELLKALALSKQNGAVDLLITGLPTGLLQLKVRFLGRDYQLRELLEEKDIHKLIEKLKSLNLTEYITLISECNSEIVTLLKDTIPTPEKFYVPRHLVRRRNLDKQIFITECQDVFVFANCTRAHLTELAAATKSHTASSRHQIEGITSRFILLEDATHWKDICDFANGMPVHLITVEKDKYILTKTTGGSRVLNQFLDHESKGAQDCIREDDVASLEKEISLCICDLPGMGKSLLLENLARIFSEYNPNAITAFISLPTVAQFLQQNQEFGKYFQAAEALALMLAPTELSGHILVLLFKKQSTEIYVYLDGLDEDPAKLLPQVKSFLNTLKKEKWIRIHVTARTHMRHELEAALGVIPYDIVPFTHDNKIQFLTKFWKNQDPSSNEVRLAEFANYCLDKWKEHMTEKGVQITGIPLQCRLLAEVYSRHALRYARESVQLNETEITETSLLQLYNSYLKIGLSRVKNQIISSTTTPTQLVTEKLLAVEQFHTWQALKLLYPKFADLYAKHYRVKTASDVGEIDIFMSMGFMLPEIGKRYSSVKFVHRTFAEFLTARFFASILSKNQPAKNINKAEKYFEKLSLDYFFRKVANQKVTNTTNTTITDLWQLRPETKFSPPDVHKFSSYVVMKFVNDELHNHSSFNNLVPSAFSNSVSAEYSYGMIISTLVQKLPLILRVVKVALAGSTWFKLRRYRRYLLQNSEASTSVSRQLGFLFVSARFANAAVARELYDILTQIFHFDLDNLHNDRPNGRPTPLHIAVKRGDYEIVELVLPYSTCCDERELLEYMTTNSREDPITVLQNKTRICQLLFSRNPLAIPFNLSDSNALFHFHRIHPCLIKTLVQNRLHIEYKDRSLLLIRVANELQPDELYDLFMFLNTNVHNEPNFKAIDFPLFEVLKFYLDAKKLISILPGVQWDAEDKYGNNLLHISSVGCQSVCMVSKCLENGVNVNSKNKFGWTCLHVAAAKRNIELIYFLLEKDASLTEKTNTGDTPLHLFFLNYKASFALLKNMALFSYRFKKHYNVNTSSLHDLVINILTSKENDQVWQILSHKNSEGHTILHNFLYNNENELEMSSETLAIMIDRSSHQSERN